MGGTPSYPDGADRELEEVWQIVPGPAAEGVELDAGDKVLVLQAVSCG